MKPLLLALLLLVLTSPCEAVRRHRRHHQRHKYRDEHVRWPMPSLAEMKRRYQWVQARNRSEGWPRWKYAGTGKGLAKR